MRILHTMLRVGNLQRSIDFYTGVLGSAYGHIALEVDDIHAACNEVRARGGRVVREAGPMKHGSTVIAFVEDPDGYKIEFIQK